MAQRLGADPHPMQFYGALRAVRDVLREHPETYVVNEGANALDFARNVIDMHVPRHRLDSGTWGVMGIGMGYAIAAAVESGAPVVAIEGDSAFGFSGMELETICRYRLPVVVIVLNNGGVYRGDGVNPLSNDPAPTTLMPQARHDRLIEAFGGKGYRATTPAEVTAALTEALASGGPALIDCVIDPSDGTESGHLTHLNPNGVEKQPDDQRSATRREPIMTELPLSGIKVIDFTGVQAGPGCTQMLAWFGADVLKVERLNGGDVTRHQLRDIPDVDALYFTMLNSNKRSLAINTKTPDGQGGHGEADPRRRRAGRELRARGHGPHGLDLGAHPRAEPAADLRLGQGLQRRLAVVGPQGL